MWSQDRHPGTLEARSLRAWQSYMVGIVVPDIGGPFMILAFSEGNGETEQDETECLLRRQIDGLLVVPAGHSAKVFDSPQVSSVPAVFFDQPLSSSRFDAVLVKNREGAREATTHLVEHGDRKIACIGVNRHPYSIRRRMEGYPDAMKKFGLPEYLSVTEPDQIDAQIDAWLRMQSPPTAIFSLNELSSVRVVQALASRRVRTPNPVAFIGFDEIQLGAWFDPPLSAVVQPATRIGEEAAINRAFYLGASRYGYAGWSGDIATGFASMAFQRRRMLAALDTGEFHWSMDTGGFSGHPSPENYARWIEFAAFVPIMRVHGDFGEKRQPWVYGPVAEAAARDAIDLRYKLLPYIYSYERLGTEGDVGLVRPLFWEFPRDPESAAQDSEWMFGDGLLVSPVVVKGATSQQVYLPPGEWIDYASGKPYRGTRNIELPVDAVTWKDIPLFVRSGSILATQPLEQYTSEHPVAELTLDVFPSARPASFVVYDDDGKTYDYEKGQYLRQVVTAARRGGATTITVDPPSGSYASPLRTYLLRIHTEAHRVLLNGKILVAVSAADLSTEAGVNWASSQDRFGPSVLLRITAGQGREVVSLR